MTARLGGGAKSDERSAGGDGRDGAYDGVDIATR
jgi:hypothetical protein